MKRAPQVMLGRKIVHHSPPALSRERLTGTLAQVRAADERETSEGILPKSEEEKANKGGAVSTEQMMKIGQMFGAGG